MKNKKKLSSSLNFPLKMKVIQNYHVKQMEAIVPDKHNFTLNYTKRSTVKNENIPEMKKKQQRRDLLT